MSSESVRIQVILTREQYELIQRLKGVMGSSDSEVVRNIVIAWLSEKSILSEKLKERVNR